MKKLLSIAFLVLFALSIAGACFAGAETAKPQPAPAGNSKCQEECTKNSNNIKSLKSCLNNCATSAPAR